MTPREPSAAARPGTEAPALPRLDVSRDTVAAVVDFAVLTALDPAVSASAVRDALVVLASRPRPAPPSLEPLVALAHARAEVWRQLRARGVHADTAPEVRVDAEPLHALTPAERTVLYLAMRCDLRAEDIGYVMDLGPRAVMRLRRQAAVSLVRAVTALALAMDLTPCPMRDGIAARGAGMLSRADVDALTMHAAECRICVEWLRKADHHALDAYRALGRPSDREVDVVVADLVRVRDDQRAHVQARAGALRRDGRPPRGPRFDSDPRRWLRRAMVLGIVSVVLVLAGLLSLSV